MRRQTMEELFWLLLKGWHWGVHIQSRILVEEWNAWNSLSFGDTRSRWVTYFHWPKLCYISPSPRLSMMHIPYYQLTCPDFLPEYFPSPLIPQCHPFSSNQKNLPSFASTSRNLTMPWTWTVPIKSLELAKDFVLLEWQSYVSLLHFV